MATFDSGGTVGTTVEIAEVESLASGSIIIGDGSGAPTTLAAFSSPTGVLNPTYGGTGSSASPTGSGSVVLATSPTLVTPTFSGASRFTSDVTIDHNLTVSNSLIANGITYLTALQISGSATIGGDTIVTLTGTQVLTNKTLTSPAVTTSLTTGSTTFALVNTTATTVNFAGAATTLNMAGGSGAVVNLGGGVNAAELRFLEPSGSGTNYTALKAQAQSANVTWTLPAAVGGAGTYLTDAAGNGTLSWATPSGADPVVTVLAGSCDYTNVDAAGTGATRVFIDDGETTLKFTDAESRVAQFSAKVPVGCTSISSIKIIYRRDSTGDLMLKFNSAKFTSSTATAVVSDRGNTATTYAGAGNDGKYTQLTVPSTYYDGLGSVVANDIIGLYILRSGGNASDTYNADWHVLGVQFTFA